MYVYDMCVYIYIYICIHIYVYSAILVRRLVLDGDQPRIEGSHGRCEEVASIKYYN